MCICFKTMTNNGVIVGALSFTDEYNE
jgi:hypothetical protein